MQALTSSLLRKGAENALAECKKIDLPKDQFPFEMDFIVRLYHSLVGLGVDSHRLVFQWGYHSASRKHVDMIYLTDGKEIVVEVEPIQTIRTVSPSIKDEKVRLELESIGNKLRTFTEKEVSERIVIVPYLGKPKSLSRPQVETDLSLILGDGILPIFIH